MSVLPFGRTHERSARVPEFQAVVLAGFGSKYVGAKSCAHRMPARRTRLETCPIPSFL